MIICNARNQLGKLSGVQRYSSELLPLLSNSIDILSPSFKWSYGTRGHFWEQFILPNHLHGRLLWSPSNTGPISIEKQVVTIHDLSPIDHPEWNAKKFSTWYNFLMPRLIKKVRMILTDSYFSKERIVYHYPFAESKIKVAHLAASKRFQQMDINLIKSALRQIEIPTPYYFLAVGSIERRKNIAKILEVWSKYNHKIPDDIWLILVGSKENKLIFCDQNFGDMPDRVHFTGHVADELLPALYSGALASIYLSLYEGFGLPILESMASGTPVICSNISSLPEVAGDSAICVSPHNTDEIGSVIVNLAESRDLRLVLRQRGLERANSFSWEKTAKAVSKALVEANY